MTTTRPRSAWLVVWAAFVVLLGGCGDADDDTDLDDSEPIEGAQLTIEGWATAVELICADAREEVMDVAPAETAEEFGPWLEVQLGILEEQADRVEALGVPTSQADDVATFIANSRETIELAREALDVQLEGTTLIDQDRVEELQQAFADRQEENVELQERLGIEGCRSDPAMLQQPTFDTTTVPE